MRPIDADSLLNDLNHDIRYLDAKYGGIGPASRTLMTMRAIIENRPTLEVPTTVHAHWVIGRDPDGCIFAVVCSHCNENYGTPSDRFCRNCGAKMDEEVKV